MSHKLVASELFGVRLAGNGRVLLHRTPTYFREKDGPNIWKCGPQTKHDR